MSLILIFGPETSGPNISPWWELEYLSVAKILIVALRAD